MQNIWQHIYAAFIEADRWKLYLKGLGVTLEVSFFAALLGILIGTIAAFLKLSTRKNGSKTIASRIASAYIDIIRGTPTTVQLLIMWSGILATCKNSVLIASLTFGINSGAYVAEIVRAGILAVDKGQMEAGRSLGLNKFQTMRYIIIPQAFKSILPPLGNEFIVLIKETSIVGYVGMRSYPCGQSNDFQAVRCIYTAAWYCIHLFCIDQGIVHPACKTGKETA